MTKPRSKAAINAGPEARAMRNIGRVKTLRAWLSEAEALAGTDRAKSPEKVESMRAELSRREQEVADLRAALDDI